MYLNYDVTFSDADKRLWGVSGHVESYMHLNYDVTFSAPDTGLWGVSRHVEI